MLSGDTRLVPFATKLGFVFVHFRFRFPESPGSSVVGVSAFNFSMTNNPQIVSITTVISVLVRVIQVSNLDCSRARDFFVIIQIRFSIFT
ncbi:hypothetical protein AXX17_AT5G00660 [Arabidopsis thaliana]|uniref:Uncharacterized protein n=1 Tax=Arabidopsis thaliana TaxID=3702 RepID=A0A178UQI6_ARATH|nr:hypothetical protein AXX17_AT5G00660 [Arabidopsis thaliana]